MQSKHLPILRHQVPQKPLNFRGFESNASCQCFNIIDCKCTSCKDFICTYVFYGKDYIDQPWYTCSECSYGQNGCCTACVKNCHRKRGHYIYTEGIVDAYCDCGANDYFVMCCALNFPPFNNLSSCTNRDQKYKIMKQRLFHCKTCGITAQNQGICETCALQCHLGHNVVYIGIREFTCDCYSMNSHCKAPSCPEISCDGLCSRLKQGKDKIFPAFVCLTCDEEGEKRFCKSCALKCHKGHDVHFNEYSNFDCKCNPCQCSKKES